MKIIFVLLSGQRYELDGVTGNTTLREIKRFLESQIPSFTRDSYKLSIAGRTGECNVDSLTKFSDYLRQVHRLDFDEESTITVHPLRLTDPLKFSH
ncbi:MAG: hypothetical protein Q8R24_07965 [Legionellaceae bacterium]|nr:hypothetical protein [Legionellaceae bacterium]